MLAKKQARRERAFKRLEIQYNSRNIGLKMASNSTYGLKGEKPDPQLVAVEQKKLERIKKEMTVLKERLEGKKKKKIDKEGAPVQEKERWFIDIHAIHLSYVKNSERRKNKGKSRKKLKKVRTTAFVKSVVAQPGMIQNYREGKMGISPRTHSFRMRKEEPNYFT